ncbi:MAG: SDR family oxidoreductase [Ignavibacteria bacterium]|nr:SDR family oxidoreductase [Ignavibacteria bacterium]
MINNKFSLEDKTILITGASSGIGRQCAISCSEMGAKVILLGRDEIRLKETLSNLSVDKAHKYYPVELTDFNKVDELVKEIIDQQGMINGLINSAGSSTTLPLKMVKPQQLNDFYSINVIAAINLARLFADQKNIVNKGGSIVFLSSVMGIVGEAGKVNYGLTKGALISGTKSLAIELSSKKIRVNCISPGVVETPMSQKSVYSQDSDMYERIKKLHPFGIGNVEDIANGCIFLLSDASRWITGSNLVIDGGYTAR